MSAEPASSERLGEVSRLCTRLADRALDAQIMGRPVSPEQVVALAKAARLLHDQGVEWPPLLEQVLHDLAHRADEGGAAAGPPAQPLDGPGDVGARGLTRFFSSLRKDKREL